MLVQGKIFFAPLDKFIEFHVSSPGDTLKNDWKKSALVI